MMRFSLSHKIFMLLSCVVLLHPRCSAQGYWDKILTSNTALSGFVTAYDVAVHNNDNIFVVGRFYRTTDFGNGISLTPNPYNGGATTDGYLMKIDGAGNTRWAKDIANDDNSGDVHQIQCKNNSLYIMVHDVNSGFTNYSRLEKRDTSGNITWSKTINSSDPINIYVDDAENIYFMYGTASGYIVQKYNSAGTSLWVHSAGTTANQYKPVDIVADVAGNYVVVGYTIPASNTVNLKVIKYNADGTTRYNQTYGTGAYGITVAIDDTASIYVGGYFSNILTMGSTTLTAPASTVRGFVAKIDSSGSNKWSAMTSFSTTYNAGSDIGIAAEMTRDRKSLAFVYGRYYQVYGLDGVLRTTRTANGTVYFSEDEAPDGSVYMTGVMGSSAYISKFGCNSPTINLPSHIDTLVGSTLHLQLGDTSLLVSWFDTNGTLLANTDTFTITVTHDTVIQVRASTVGGCLATMNITINGTCQITQNRSITICEGNTYQGHTQSGTYRDTVVGAPGCDTINVLQLTVLQSTHSTISQSICAGQSYLGHNTTGTFIDTLHNAAANGCDSIRTLNLTVLQPARSTINQSICAGQSYLGHNTTGTFTDTLHNASANGCDSIRTLNLTVLQAAHSTISQSICAGQSYLSHNTTGTFTDTLHNATANGCDSIRTLNLTVLQPAHSNISQSICAGQSYLGHSTTGTFTDTLHNAAANGCDSIRTLNLTVNNATTASVSASICPGSGYNFYGHILTSAGTYYDTLVNSHGCDSIVTLTLSQNNYSTGSISASVCAGGSYAFNGQQLTAAGVYYDTVAGSNCDSIIALTLTVLQPARSTISQSICAGQSYLGHSTTGTFTDTLHNAAANGCDSIRTLNLTVNNASTASVSASICPGNSYNFYGHLLTSAGTYYDTLVNTHGCDSIVTLTLSQNSYSTGSASASICAGDSYTFNGQQLTAAGVYYDTVAGSNCDSIIALTLTVLQPAYSTISQSICAGQSYLSHNTTGTFTDTLHNAAANGCDSIRTLNLTVLQPAHSTISQSICAGQSYLSHNTTGTFTDTLHNAAANGCDSIRTLNLTVNNATTASISASICPGSSYNFYGHILTSAGTYYDTLANSHGCDSIVTLTLSQNSYSTGSTSASICSGNSYTFNGQQLTVAGVYYDTVVGSNCDSIIALTLTVLQPARSTINQSICAGQSYLGHDTTGIFTDTLHNAAANGCDSIRTLNLTVNPSSTDTLTQSICQGDVFEGHSVGGTYVDSLQSASGCDSIHVLVLTVNALPQPTISLSGDTLGTQAFASYQWFRDNALLAGDTMQSLVATQNGDYAVLVTDANGCSDTSAAYQVLGVGIGETAIENGIHIYPNPNNGRFTLSINLPSRLVKTEVLNMQGQTLLTEQTNSQPAFKKEIDITDYAKGVYLLKISSENFVVVKRIILQ